MPELLNDEEISASLDAFADWGRDGRGIRRDLRFADFGAAIAFVDQVAAVAERLDHHPDILVHGFNRVRVTTSTHSAGGLTAKDFELAAAIDALRP